ncbi:cholecystokinin receptor-like [Penaeus monodon]|uniref:cholecystokinin receptor-like n=1 Tax=Penaeus monodon TaxID=6687 RepID=UPI0018A74B39|nr:cholecystokinin receptor-like [Penaeus monodon]
MSLSAPAGPEKDAVTAEEVVARLEELEVLLRDRYHLDQEALNQSLLALITNGSFARPQDAQEGWVWTGQALVLVPVYSVMLLLAVVGNALVMVTLLQNKRMRTATNLMLLNLAMSDLLLGVVCMPFTLTGFLLRDFIFGAIMCRVIPYLQAVSVSVSAWTLVAISVERYYGICYPLRARRWRSLRHAHCMISVVWAGSLLAMMPIAATSTLLPMKEKGRHKCRETWPTAMLEQGYNVFLVIVLLVIPLVLMLAAYCRISRVLWRDIREEGMPQGVVAECCEMEEETGPSFPPPSTPPIATPSPNISTNTATTSNSSPGGGSSGSGSSQVRRKALLLRTSRFYRPSKQASYSTTPAGSSPQPPRCSVTTSILRKTHPEISLRNKKRVIHMLAVVVVEFFVCWTPLYVVNTLAYWFPQHVYHWLGMDGVVVIQLLAYCSCCCNPLTYCFMNHSFRRAFLNAVGCGKASRRSNTCDDARFISRKS